MISAQCTVCMFVCVCVYVCLECVYIYQCYFHACDEPVHSEPHAADAAHILIIVLAQHL